MQLSHGLQEEWSLHHHYRNQRASSAQIVEERRPEFPYPVVGGFPAPNLLARLMPLQHSAMNRSFEGVIQPGRCRRPHDCASNETFVGPAEEINLTMIVLRNELFHGFDRLRKSVANSLRVGCAFRFVET